MVQFIENVLIGVRQWVDGKISDIINDSSLSDKSTWSSSKISGEFEAKQGVLTAGNHISISANNEIDTTGVVVSQYIANIWRGTQAEYDALSSYDNNTLYVIVEQQ